MALAGELQEGMEMEAAGRRPRELSFGHARAARVTAKRAGPPVLETKGGGREEPNTAGFPPLACNTLTPHHGGVIRTNTARACPRRADRTWNSVEPEDTERAGTHTPAAGNTGSRLRCQLAAVATAEAV